MINCHECVNYIACAHSGVSVENVIECKFFKEVNEYD